MLVAASFLSSDVVFMYISVIFRKKCTSVSACEVEWKFWLEVSEDYSTKCGERLACFCYNLYVVAVAVYRDLASQGLKGFITDEISHLKDLVSL